MSPNLRYGSRFDELRNYGSNGVRKSYAPTPVTFGDAMENNSSLVGNTMGGVQPSAGGIAESLSQLSGSELNDEFKRNYLEQMDKFQSRNTLGKMFYNTDGSFDWGAVGSVAQALGGLGQLYLGFQANKTAKDALNFEKQAYQTNLQNQKKSYNMSLEDRAYARASQTNSTRESANDYIKKHKL